jgi:hypothetical protein
MTSFGVAGMDHIGRVVSATSSVLSILGLELNFISVFSVIVEWLIHSKCLISNCDNLLVKAFILLLLLLFLVGLGFELRALLAKQELYVLSHTSSLVIAIYRQIQGSYYFIICLLSPSLTFRPGPI